MGLGHARRDLQHPVQRGDRVLVLLRVQHDHRLLEALAQLLLLHLLLVLQAADEARLGEPLDQPGDQQQGDDQDGGGKGGAVLHTAP
ncbi:hypothetical protein HK415_13375 [Ramlibacter sp. B156]|uniref:Uncharacterized protein n=1 Tax=Ramlibacter montanisoli TaxID=2732512 RepID=A0A849KQ37_9BURK|nr:hypothetical protein [Ramlibacter montanisoli]